MSQWLNEVCKIKLEDIILHKKYLISIESSITINNVLNLLKDENILSVPIYGLEGSWLGSGGVNLIANHRQYIGIISIIDILVYILNHSSNSSNIHNFESILNHRIVDVIGSTNESLSLWVESPTRPLYYVLEQFCKGYFYSIIFYYLFNSFF